MENEANPPPSTGEASAPFQGTDLTRQFRYKSGISKNQPLRCERVNEVTYKITAGEFTNVPASHGQWGGYRTAKAEAWIICIAPGVWLARCGDKACGPSSFSEAKRDALAMMKGAPGDYQICNPVGHLNGLQARLAQQAGVIDLADTESRAAI
jgi:hypothetical protein